MTTHATARDLPPLAEQAERLIDLGAHQIGGLTAAHLRHRAGRARFDGGLLVMHPVGVPASKLAPLIQREGKRGFVVTDMRDVDDFAPTRPVTLPAGPV